MIRDDTFILRIICFEEFLPKLLGNSPTTKSQTRTPLPIKAADTNSYIADCDLEWEVNGKIF